MANSAKPDRLLRSTKDRVLAGVCGGLGEYFHIDPVLFRILFVLATVWGGSGVGIYIILWVVIPDAEHANASFEQNARAAGAEMKTKAKQAAKSLGLGKK